MVMERRTSLANCMCYAIMMVEEEYEEDASAFAYDGLLVSLNILFDQVDGFTFHPREGYNLSPITSMNDIPPDIRGLEKYFTLRNPCWIEHHSEGVRRKPEGIEVEPPKPKKTSSGLNFDDNADVAF